MKLVHFEMLTRFLLKNWTDDCIAPFSVAQHYLKPLQWKWSCASNRDSFTQSVPARTSKGIFYRCWTNRADISMLTVSRGESQSWGRLVIKATCGFTCHCLHTVYVHQSEMSLPRLLTDVTRMASLGDPRIEHLSFGTPCTSAPELHWWRKNCKYMQANCRAPSSTDSPGQTKEEHSKTPFAEPV